ncbi:MAG: asparagine synthase (glutamine-hydrolyzing), partial [Patescibacteria group bacterium]
RQLFLARDRLGKKPLKYYVDKNVFIFASELKSILKNPEVKKEPDQTAIANYLSFQYTPSSSTGFNGIKKLPPAHYCLVKENGELETHRYWNLDYREKWQLSEEEWVDKITDKLGESVKLRMMSDVPLGAFLSGGVDSSAIVALMSKYSNSPVKTFSIGFNEATHNELPYAKTTAIKFNTEHREFIVTPNILEIIPKIAYYYEEPYADSSAIPSWYLAETTKKYVTVALNGDGGDENFAGYLRYNFYQIVNKHPVLATIFGPLAVRLFLKPKWRQEKAIKLIRELKKGSSAAEKYFPLIAYIDNYPNHAIEILKEKFNEALSNDSLDQLLWVDINSYLPNDLLVKMDIATMAHSLEARSPLLDHEFMELTAKIPSSLKLRGDTNKYIFKKALEKILPAEIL